MSDLLDTPAQQLPANRAMNTIDEIKKSQGLLDEMFKNKEPSIDNFVEINKTHHLIYEKIELLEQLFMKSF